MERLTCTAFSLLFALGCAGAHDADGPADPDAIDRPDPEPTASIWTPPLSPPPLPLLPAGPSRLEACLGDGGRLAEVARVDNDDSAEHGDVLTFAVAPDRRIAVAAEDGTVKLWTLDGFLGAVTPGALAYGAELPLVPATDVDFYDDFVVVADIRGAVTGWTIEGGMRPLGGVEPGIRVTAVAVDRARLRIAHADEREGGHVMVRGLEDPTTVGPLETGLSRVTDVGFVADGDLVLAGGADGPTVELRDADDPNAVLATWRSEAEGDVFEVSARGDVVAVADSGGLTLLDSELAPRWREDAHRHAPVSVAVSSGGRFTFSAGAEGALAVRGAEDGAVIDEVDVTDPVGVRVDPAGAVVLVASRAGMLRAFACE